MIEIGNIKIENPLLLAPMAGVTDPPFREIVQSFGSVGLMFSEMIPSKSLFLGNREKSINKVNRINLINAVQIAGNDPYYMAEAAKLNVDLGADMIDINFGCPVKKVTKGFAGAAVMRDEQLAKQIMKSVVKAINVPTTIKMRLGWDSQSINAPVIAKIAEDVGIKMITVHGRTRCQMYNGKADWSLISKVKDVVKIPVIVNGDINDFDSLHQALRESRADGAMIARGVYGKPWIFREIASKNIGESFEKPTGNKLKNLVLKHLNLAIIYYGEDNAIPIFRKHLNWYSHSLKGSSEFRNRINKINNYNDIAKEIEKFFCEK